MALAMTDLERDAIATWEAGRPFFHLHGGAIPDRAIAFMADSEALCMQIQPVAPYKVVGWTFHTAKQTEAYCRAYPLDPVMIS